MFTLIKKIAVAAVFATFAQAALAAEYQVTVQSDLLTDEISGTAVFGYTAPVNAIQVSFKVNSVGVTRLAAGTVINSSTGAAFTSAVQLVPASSISDFVANIGGASFSLADLQNNILGTTGQQFGILLVGELAENGVSAAKFTLVNGAGGINFGALNCGVSCSISNNGDAADASTGGIGILQGTDVFIQALTPPPTPKQLLVDLATDIKNSNIKPLVKLALDVPLALAAIALKKNNLVQATNSMKAFIALLQPLVKLKTLTQAQADDFKAQALDIIDAM